MKAVIQRVSSASVTVQGNTVATINKGLLVLVGIENADTADDILWLSNKIVQLRLFDDIGSTHSNLVWPNSLKPNIH